MKYGNIFWGVVLITLGVLFAMRNLDIFFFSWRSAFRLWPLIFVFWGIAILPVKSMVKLLLTVITVVIGIVILASNPGNSHDWFRWEPYTYQHEREDDGDHSDWNKQAFSEAYDSDVKYATLNLDAAAGDFHLEGITSMLFEFETEGNTGPYSVVTENIDDDKIVIDFDHRRFSGRNNLEHKVWMKLNDNPVWDINIDVGAAQFDLDLAPFKVAKIDIDGGASALDLKLGKKYEKVIVNVDAGASDIHIRVPEEMACEVTTQTILSGKELNGFEKIKKGVYKTPGYSTTSAHVVIDIDAAVSGVSVVRY